jgi:hypothetical protein
MILHTPLHQNLDNNTLQGGQGLPNCAHIQGNQPCFEIIFVPDPTRTTTPALASADLAFIKTIITSQEYMSMKHLTGSVHYISSSGSVHGSMNYTVYMQEWVCKILIYIK